MPIPEIIKITNIAKSNGSKEDLAIIRGIGKLVGDHAVTANSSQFTNTLMVEWRQSRQAEYYDRSDFQNLDIDMFNALKYHSKGMAALISNEGFYKWQEENIKTGQILETVSMGMAQVIYVGAVFRTFLKTRMVYTI